MARPACLCDLFAQGLLPLWELLEKVRGSLQQPVLGQLQGVEGGPENDAASAPWQEAAGRAARSAWRRDRLPATGRGHPPHRLTMS